MDSAHYGSVPRARRWGVVLVAVAVWAAAAAAGRGAAQDGRTAPPSIDSMPSTAPAVYGTVTDPEGTPIPNARVEILLHGDFRADYAITDANGAFAIPVPTPSESWEVRASAAGYLTVSTRVGIIHRERVDLTLQPDPRPVAERRPEPRERGRARRVMREGLELASAGQRGEAITALRRAVELDPDYAAAHNNLGVQLHLAGDLAAAEDALRTAVALAPLDFHANYNLGALLFEQRRHHEAAPPLEMAVLADPTSAKAEALLGRAYLALGLAGASLKHLLEAQRMAGATVDLSLEISDAYVLVGDLETALRTKQRWLSANASDPRAARVAATVQTLQARLASQDD